jgi:hypothetical protein
MVELCEEFQRSLASQSVSAIRQIFIIQNIQHSNNVYDKHLRKIDFLIRSP